MSPTNPLKKFMLHYIKIKKTRLVRSHNTAHRKTSTHALPNADSESIYFSKKPKAPVKLIFLKWHNKIGKKQSRIHISNHDFVLLRSKYSIAFDNTAVLRNDHIHLRLHFKAAE